MNAFLDFFAQTVDLSALYSYGPLGLITAWFMFIGHKIANDMAKEIRNNTIVVAKELRDLSHRTDGLARAILADVLTRDCANEHAHKFAAEQLAKIEARDQRDREGAKS